MTEAAHKLGEGRKCSQCGNALPAGSPFEACPKCLLKAGMRQAPNEGPAATMFIGLDPARCGLPVPGEDLGHYSIIRLLGQGGMGAVYEAQDRESGRRVALKVLSQALDAPEARERFLREGRLAASINHPNSVYVFGTEEIGGTPVIAMELMEGGTLEDKVRCLGALSPAEAVDAVLQIIAGLDAAHKTGVLHRDIKPSNCFVAPGGTVKIGDFGLSISTTIRVEPALTVKGAFLGTPAFCSPEQLRGDELSTRSDMYSVGATLFYLLTGRTPFESKHVVQLLATVLEQRAPSPRQLKPAIPQGLARIVSRCLEKQPSERFKTYDDLGRALAPYSSTAPTPATMGFRFLAGAIDMLGLGLLSAASYFALFGSPIDYLTLPTENPLRFFLWGLGWMIGSALYYAVLEGLFGAAIGKALCGLRVIGRNRTAPGFRRALVRSALYELIPALPFWFCYELDPKWLISAPSPLRSLLGLSSYFVIAALFSSARRRNGFAALQDLVTGTRVVSKVALQLRPALAPDGSVPEEVARASLVGPYHLLGVLEQSPEVAWHIGYDMRLLRRVWIRTVPPGTPPVPDASRNLGRVGRLRWLTGVRSPQGNWDAFEALTGKPLLRINKVSWREARFWLFDLACELEAAMKDETLPPLLALDRIWITGEGRAKLLDFPAPGLGEESLERPGPPQSAPCDDPRHTAQPFLAELAAMLLAAPTKALGSSMFSLETPLPIHARQFLGSITGLAGTHDIIGKLRPLLHRTPKVTRMRSAAVVFGCLALPVLASLGMAYGTRMMDNWNQKNPDLMELSQLLSIRSATRSYAMKAQGPTDSDFAIYAAAHYRRAITNASLWSNPLTMTLLKEEGRRFARNSVSEYPAPNKEELAQAEAAVGPLVKRQKEVLAETHEWIPFVAPAIVLLIYVCLPALMAALLFRGGVVLWIAGVAHVNKNGERASRLRMFLRGVIAWSPLLAGALLFLSLRPHLGTARALALAALPLCVLTIVSLLLPERGLPDRLAGAWPVPR